MHSDTGSNVALCFSSADLPNHKLHYPVGVNFCLEDSIEVIGVTVNCSLQTNINPVAEFNFIVTHNSQGVTLPLHGDVNVISESSQSVTVAINVSLLLSGVISVNCDVSNVNGNDSASTNVTLCGEFLLHDLCVLIRSIIILKERSSVLL